MARQRQLKNKILIAVGVMVVLILLIMLALSGGNMALLKSLFTDSLTEEELSEQLHGFGWRGYVVVAALSALQVLFTFLPAEPVQVLGGFAFGFPIGLLCCAAGVLLGSSMIFMLQKLFGNRLRRFFVKKLNLDFEKIAHSSKATVIIFLLYFLPAIPYGLISFLAASMGLSYRRFILITAFGSLPSICIGVGLGHMVIASSGVVLICTLAVLVLLAVLLLCNREMLFSKLNNYADRTRMASKTMVRPVNQPLLNVLYVAVRFYLFLSGMKIKTVNKVGKPNKPAIVLCNHGSFIDFIYAAALLRTRKPHFIVARLYFYHSLLGGLLRRVGAFPKSMFTMDMENAKNCLTVLKNKELLAMMPEARLSTAGRFEDIQDTTFAFIKKAGVDVYTIKINGDYLADPKWGKGFRRGSVVEAELDILFTAEQVKEIPLEQLQQAVVERLSYDEFQWLEERPSIHYRSPRMAEGLENILSVCPICHQKHTLSTKKNQVFCSNCGHLTDMDDRYAFDEGFQFRHLGQWYDWQKARLAEEIARDENYTLTSNVELRLPGDGKNLTRHGGSGVCTLNRDGLTYSGTKDGETVELHFSIQRIYRLLFGAGENFEIYDGTQILYFVPEEKRSAVDWYMTSMILHDTAAK